MTAAPTTYVATFLNGDVARKTSTRRLTHANLVIEDANGTLKSKTMFYDNEALARAELATARQFIEQGRGNLVNFAEVVAVTVDAQQAGLPEYETAAEIAAAAAASAPAADTDADG